MAKRCLERDGCFIIGQPTGRVVIPNPITELRNSIYYVTGLPSKDYHKMPGYCEGDFETQATELNKFVAAKDKAGLLRVLKKCITKRIDHIIRMHDPRTTIGNDKNVQEQGHMRIAKMIEALHDFLEGKDIHSIISIEHNDRAIRNGGYAFNIRVRPPPPAPGPGASRGPGSGPGASRGSAPASKMYNVTSHEQFPLLTRDTAKATTAAPAAKELSASAPEYVPGTKGLSASAPEYVPGKKGGAKKTRKAKRSSRKTRKQTRRRR